MTAIGMTLMVLGALIAATSFSGSAASKSKSGKNAGCGALLCIGGMMIGIGGNPASDMPNGSPAMVAIGFICAIIGIVMLVKRINTAKDNHQQQAVRIALSNKVAFYKECAANGIYECHSDKEIQKATLIAGKQNLKFTDISALFYECKSLYEKNEADKKTAAMNAACEKERAACAELEKYSGHSGRSKRIAILTAEKNTALETAKSLRAGASAIMGATQQKEHDWAILGGIADGIAGPGAGIATALDVQSQNAQIRAQNAANRQAFAPIVMSSYTGAADQESKAQKIQAEIDAAKIKLVSNDSAASCLEHLAFSGTRIEVSETGTCTVTANARLKSPMIIFDDVDAIIDGTVKAQIYDGTNMIGTAQMVLPKYGIGKSDAALKGMSLFFGKPDKAYTVKFTASNLWAMER